MNYLSSLSATDNDQSVISFSLDLNTAKSGFRFLSIFFISIKYIGRCRSDGPMTGMLLNEKKNVFFIFLIYKNYLDTYRTFLALVLNRKKETAKAKQAPISGTIMFKRE